MKFVKHLVLALIIMSGTTIVAQTTVTETSGTSNYLPKFGTVPNLVNSQIIDNGTYMSIMSTATPSLILGATNAVGGENFSVQRNWSGSTFTRVYNNNTQGTVNYVATGGGSSIAMSAYGTGYLSVNGMYEQGAAVLAGSGNTMNIGTSASTPFTFWTNNTKRMTLSTTGNLSIGNTNNTYPLDVTGTINSSAQLRSGNATNYLYMGWDGSHSSLTSTGTNLLLNYSSGAAYTGKDVELCTGSGGGYVINGTNVEIGSPTRDANTALNIKVNGTMTLGLRVRNSSNTDVFAVSNTGTTIMTGNQYMTSTGVIQCGGLLPIGTTTDLGLYSLRSGYYERFVTNGGNFNFYSDGGTTPEGGTPIFTIASNGNTTVPSLTVGTTGAGSYRALYVDNSGKIVSSNNTTSTTSSTWKFGGNSSAGAIFGATDSGSDLPIYAGGNEVVRVTAAGNLSLNCGSTANSGTQLILKDLDHGIGYFNNFSKNAAGADIQVNGPVIYGYSGGALATVNNYPVSPNPPTQKIALRWDANGQVHIGNRSNIGAHSDALLSVDGKALFTSAYVNVNSSVWADYVFEKNYALPSLNEVEKFYLQNKHLPGVPSAKEMEEKGNNLVETDATLLKKIEELTIYMVAQQKTIDQLKQTIDDLKKK